ENIVDAAVDGDGGKNSRAAARRLLIKATCRAVLDGRGEELHLEVDDLAALLWREVGHRFGVAARCSVGLVQQIEVDRLPPEGFAPVPHHRGEKLQIRRRQRPAEERQLATAGE